MWLFSSVIFMTILIVITLDIKDIGKTLSRIEKHLEEINKKDRS